MIARKMFLSPFISLLICHCEVSSLHFLLYLASPVDVSSWLTQALYTSTGLVLMPNVLFSMMSLTTGASSCLNVLCPRAPLLKLTTIFTTVGFPVTMSWIWSTLELRHMEEFYTTDVVFEISHKTKKHIANTSLNYYNHNIIAIMLAYCKAEL